MIQMLNVTTNAFRLLNVQSLSSNGAKGLPCLGVKLERIIIILLVYLLQQYKHQVTRQVAKQQYTTQLLMRSQCK